VLSARRYLLATEILEFMRASSVSCARLSTRIVIVRKQS
jgi:hypothetical protein